jgi:hypothetical protein
MSTTDQQIQARIENKGIRSEDIKHPGRLTDEQIASIDTELVYTWVRTGQWKAKDFRKWLKVMCVID